MEISTATNGVLGFFNTILGAIFDFLPDSPFTGIIDSVANTWWLGALNWIVDIKAILNIGALWCAAIAVFYSYQIILRWIKAVDA